jgi:hypothetical protein
MDVRIAAHSRRTTARSSAAVLHARIARIISLRGKELTKLNCSIGTDGPPRIRRGLGGGGGPRGNTGGVCRRRRGSWPCPRRSPRRSSRPCPCRDHGEDTPPREEAERGAAGSDAEVVGAGRKQRGRGGVSRGGRTGCRIWRTGNGADGGMCEFIVCISCWVDEFRSNLDEIRPILTALLKVQL